ncbi:hypothetical protein TRFO_02117 [Tritrichomonas foetus]|uniref:CCZ1/INTU/HSP4 first Longin domain-containing protein n=1 Tax=Tritrichomonas foetus TaxID=1144522 RepID=A0A1J4JD35_9EUKA|nr:hypothetical protein TRFO_02117 [Tritrichomonas foetus]|eukprot:OHS95188.1 hypothetical protein TRFO_02117 [Tritrichomonas foetus]
MQNPESVTCFCVFYHNPFKRGNEGAEEGHILEQLIYKYPPTLSDRMMEHILGIMISLYTFTTLSMKKKELDFMAWSKSKVAIRTTTNPDGSVFFFLLRAPAACSNSSISKMLDHIKNGIFFSIGPEKMYSIPDLQNYLNNFGNSILSKLLPFNLPTQPNANAPFNPLPFSFTNLQNAEWHRPSVATLLTEVTLMQTFPELWGIACYFNDLLLVSHSPIDLIRCFDFVEDSKKAKVYLTKEDRLRLLEFPGSVSKIPEQEIIEANLLKFQHDSVSFYLLTDPNLSQETHEKIHESLIRALPDISNVTPDVKKPIFPQNTLVYNRVLNMLRFGNASEDFQETAIYGHDLFAREPQLRDVVMHNSKEFSLCMNIVNFEHYASINGGSKMSLLEMYDESLRANPELLPFLQSFHPSQ